MKNRSDQIFKNHRKQDNKGLQNQKTIGEQKDYNQRP